MIALQNNRSELYGFQVMSAGMFAKTDIIVLFCEQVYNTNV